MELYDGGRGEPCQEDWARKDGGSDQCNDKAGHVGIPSGVGHRWLAMVEPTVQERGTSRECSPP
jgi:hypothetical protein